MKITDPKIVITVAQTAAIIRLNILRSEMPSYFGPAIKEILGTLQKQDIEAIGGVFAHHHILSDTHFDFSVGFRLKLKENQIFQESGRVCLGELPKHDKVAFAKYIGPYEGLFEAWAEFQSWMESNHHVPKSELWETYEVNIDCGVSPIEYVTELYRPID